jgi:peptidoglycan/xylan/chitin deacetylase (PgdA/CDA1 family)
MKDSNVTATLSLEIELGHGVVRGNSLHKLSENREQETKQLRQLLALCDELRVPITFNVVGHLLLHHSLDDYNTHLYPDGWFDPIPKTGRKSDPLFYAPDLVTMIDEATVDHEICTHTFSHIVCDSLPKETVRYDLRQARHVHDEFGLEPPKSLVPPKHSQPPRDVLREMGIEIIRLMQYQLPKAKHPPTRAHRAYDIISGKHPTCSPRLVDDIIESYTTNALSIGSSLLPSGQALPHPAFRVIPVSIRRQLHYKNLVRPLDEAAPAGFVHYWSHLYDISNEYQFPQVERFIKELSQHNNVSVRTMSQLNDQMGNI